MKKKLMEYIRSDDIWDVTALLFSGQPIIAIVWSDGEQEFLDEEYYREESREALAKKRGKNIAKVYKITAEPTA